MNAPIRPDPSPAALKLCCPACRGRLEPSPDAAQQSALICANCTLSFPILGDVICALPAGDADLALWEARAHNELQQLLAQQQTVERALKTTLTPAAGDLTRRRLEALHEAYSDQVRCVTELLAPLLAGRAGSDSATYTGLKAPALSNNTTLFSYATNLFRDWVWGDDENEQTVAMLASVAKEPLGRTLVLGAGGGRLAWDLAQSAASEVIAVDINPLTSFAAAAISRGRDVSLWEFPLAPVTTEDVALKRTLGLDAETAAPLTWVLADARALPFPTGSFDTVVTPWFTDVVQSAPTTTANLINRLLTPGGRWLNFGSVAFADADPAKCFVLPELCEIVKGQGFSDPAIAEERGPYLCSPHSRFGRHELLHAFAATKIRETADQSVPADTLPGWLSDTQQPVPALAEFQDQAMATQVHAYLMSLIDGKRSINEIAIVLQDRKLMSAREAAPLIQGFLGKMLKSQG